MEGKPNTQRFWNGSGTEKKEYSTIFEKKHIFEIFFTSLDDCQ
jgi:hypothetical protein